MLCCDKTGNWLLWISMREDFGCYVIAGYRFGCLNCWQGLDRFLGSFLDNAWSRQNPRTLFGWQQAFKNLDNYGSSCTRPIWNLKCLKWQKKKNCPNSCKDESVKLISLPIKKFIDSCNIISQYEHFQAFTPTKSTSCKCKFLINYKKSFWWFSEFIIQHKELVSVYVCMSVL